MAASASLQRRLFGVVAIAIAPVALMSAVALYVGYVDQRQQAQNNGLEVARALSQSVSGELRKTVSVVEALTTGFGLVGGDLARFDEVLRDEMANHPDWLALTLSDNAGRTLLDTRLARGTAITEQITSDSHDYVVRTGRPAVGYLMRDAKGKWVFPIRVPIMRAGKVSHVLSVVLDPDLILRLLQAQSLSSEWAAATADSKGLRVARTRNPAASLGTPYSPQLTTMIRTGAPEGIGITQNTEGLRVFTAFVRDPTTGWVTALGASVAAVEQAALRNAATLGFGILLSAMLGLLAAGLMARRILDPVARLSDNARAIGRGEGVVASRSGIREIDEVAVALAQAGADREVQSKREQEARAVAEQANRAKDEFLAMLGHELRNPLSAIASSTHILEQPAVDPSLRTRATSIIARQVKNLSRLTDDLLDAARALTGKIVLRMQPVDLARVAQQAIAAMRATGRLADHHLAEDLQGAWVNADSVRLDQVVANLLVNATKYTPNGGHIRVSVREEAGFAVLRVADDGVGLSPELRARVFDLFVQGERELDRSQGGLGIGLTLVRRIAELHGGSAHAESEGAHRGAEFIVRLPAIAAPVPATGPAVQDPATPRHILIVEDSPDARASLTMLLEAQGHRVDVASDGEEGLSMALALRPEVAIIDIGLPRMDGYEVARAIRQQAADRKPYLIALTGYGADSDIARAADAGFDRHLVKPANPAELAAAIVSAP